MRIGVEVGGTFTDLVAIEENGIRVTKVPSVPSEPNEGAFNAISSLLSGPAAGVMGAVRQAGRSGYKNLITLDMGGRARMFV